MKDKSEIRKELLKLMTAEIEASIVYRYYTNQITRMLTEALENAQALAESVKVEELSGDEREKLRIKLRQSELEGQACKEATALIRRLSDKARRKVNEAEQRLNAFCKRHGIEDIGDYIKDLE